MECVSRFSDICSFPSPSPSPSLSLALVMSLTPTRARVMKSPEGNVDRCLICVVWHEYHREEARRQDLNRTLWGKDHTVVVKKVLCKVARNRLSKTRSLRLSVITGQIEKLRMRPSFVFFFPNPPLQSKAVPKSFPQENRNICSPLVNGVRWE